MELLNRGRASPGAQILALDRELRAARSLSEACELLSISWDQAHRIMERAVARGLERRGLEEVDAVGIDEKSLLSGQSYVSVLSDPKGSRVLEVHRRPGTRQCRATFRERGTRTAAKSGRRGDGHGCSF